MRFFLILLVFSFSACSDGTEDRIPPVGSEICQLSFEMLGPCVYKNIKVNVVVDKSSSDEILIKKLNVVNQEKNSR